MPSAACQRFVESMVIDYVKWHDGDGYDLEALAKMTPDEQVEMQAQLIARLDGQSADWRDAEALAALPTVTAHEAVEKARRHRDPAVRKYVLENLLDAAPERVADLEDDVVTAVRNGALDLARDHPTPRVKRALLDCARLGTPENRVSAAALLMYLTGHAPEPFDWNQRPFFLRFNTENMTELRAAWTELRERTGI